MSESDRVPPIAIHCIGEHDEEKEYMEYWLSRPVLERLAFVETLRLEYGGKAYESQPRLPRSLDAIQCFPSYLGGCGRAADLSNKTGNRACG